MQLPHVSDVVPTMTKSTVLCALLAFLLAVRGHDAERFPPGVPPKPNADSDIRFHEPSAFQEAGQPVPPPRQEYQGQGGSQPPAAQDPSMPAHARHMGGKHTFGGVRGKGLDMSHEKEHMKEHLEEAYIDLDDMNEIQLIATYFRSFDMDKNGRIDGLELLKAITKMNSEHGDAGDSVPEADIQGLVPELDEELSFYDDNNDGLINYAEFMINHKKRIQA